MAVLAAAVGALLCFMAAVAVDLGSLALHARRLQGTADLAALAAARNIDRAEAAAIATTVSNLTVSPEVLVETGRYLADRSLPVPERFVLTDQDPDAARVTLRSRAPIYFGRLILGRGGVAVTRSATAAAPDRRPSAMFSIGSRLASLDGGLANQLLSGLTGSAVSLNLMDYQALVSTRVNLLTWFDALAVDARLEAGDYEALLRHDLDAGRALKVLEMVAGGDASSALSKVSQAALGLRITLADLIGVDATSRRGLSGALDAEIGVMDLVTAMLETGGNRQLALDLGAQAGISDLRVTLAIGERPNQSPWLTVSDRAEPVVRTAQARLYLRATTAQKLSGLAQVELPILVELAASEARLKTIECGVGASDPSARVEIEARPGLVTAAIGVVDENQLGDFKAELSPSPATAVSALGMVRVVVQSRLKIAEAEFESLIFSRYDIENHIIKTAKVDAITQSVFDSLIHDMRIDVDVAGLGVGIGNLASALGILLGPLAPTLDALIADLLDLTGLRLGEADVAVLGLRCGGATTGRPALVG